MPEAMPTVSRPAAPAPPGVVAELVLALTAVLRSADVAQPRQEARDIVATLLDVPRFWPTANPAAAVDAGLEAAAWRAAKRRAAGAPFAYAVGRAAYRHLTLDVDDRVLIPRQETELLPEIVLAMVPQGGGLAVDIGTGSGAIALSLATEGRFDRVVATDVSRDALAVAERNVRLLDGALRAPVELRHGAGLAPVRGERARAIVANPPYIAFGELAALPPSVRDWEPAEALSCAGEGMDVTASLVLGAADVLEPGGVLALEVDVRRAALVAELVATHGRYRDVGIRLDLAGRERFVVARRKEE
ncbi:MAG TPA: HemK/PrmC family methyltransferase [Gemmatimonadaceae bacterium]|nr:HemK/PrmC family methyltransferase [Gemmatimonadaceae bacterium]